ncbi:hypothetical protein CO111_02840 [Candidatus Desantisbacteria bacterium CG_4_9_14_3_um_filter_50_7]|nr:MAG: hypothetical protein CO111_02840 [Candidatus Desantisbacteria bacterium CG_4_9_14_3_um_filter_50_7]
MKGWDMKNRIMIFIVAIATGFAVTAPVCAQNVEKRMNDPVTIEFKNLDIAGALKNISNMTKITILPGTDVEGKVTGKYSTVPLWTVLKALCDSTGSTYTIIDDVLYIVKLAKDGSKPAIAAKEEEKAPAKEQKKPCTEKLIMLQYIKASDAVALLPTGIPAANLKVLEEQNAIYVSGGEDVVRKTEDYISVIDVSPPQVMMEILVIEATRTAGEDFQFGFAGKQDNITASAQSASYTQLDIRSVDFLPKEFSIMLKASISKGKTKVKANPRIVTVSGKEAIIKTGTGGYYKDGATYPWQIKMFDYGIILRARPWVTASGEIILELHPEVNTVTGKTADNLPEMNRRTVDTTVRVKNGQTVTIGGLIQEDEILTSKKVPFLGDIPFLGALFTSKTLSTTQKEVVIYVTPTILTNTNR